VTSCADPDNITDRAFAHDVLRAVPCPVAVIPGNHDVGFFDAALDHRLQAFRSTWGADCAVTRSDVGSATHVWAPSATLTGERHHGGDPTPGAVEYHFEADTAWPHRFVDPATVLP
jgi:hypothetical protein